MVEKVYGSLMTFILVLIFIPAYTVLYRFIMIVSMDATTRAFFLFSPFIILIILIYGAYKYGEKLEQKSPLQLN